MDATREQLINLLGGKGAHIEFEKGVADFPAELRGKRLRYAPHTAWQLLEHMRIAQWDILEFSRNPKHVSPKWPDGYWPSTAAPPDDQAWDKSIRQYRKDLAAMKKYVANPKRSLSSKIPHGDGQTLLREVLLLADHSSYHLGQLVFLRRMLEKK
jgi:hypothetical protein